MAIVDLDFIAWRDEQRERFPQFFNDLSASRVHMAFREEVALAAFRAGKAIGRDRALSHAAGQDGEQCRAASGVEEIARQMDAMAGHIQASSPEQKSERLRGWASMLRALSRGVPEGKVLVPSEPTEAMKIAALKALDPLGELVDWKEEGVSRRDVSDCYAAMIDAAISAQRKEG